MLLMMKAATISPAIMTLRTYRDPKPRPERHAASLDSSGAIGDIYLSFRAVSMASEVSDTRNGRTVIDVRSQHFIERQIDLKRTVDNIAI
jgi:hypothetical protein